MRQASSAGGPDHRPRPVLCPSLHLTGFPPAGVAANVVQLIQFTARIHHGNTEYTEYTELMDFNSIAVTIPRHQENTALILLLRAASVYSVFPW